MRGKRITTILLAVLMLFGLLVPVAAASGQARHPFVDVGVAWYDDAVQFAFQNNVMQGVGNNQFSPDGTFTIAQVIATIFRVEHGRTANQNDSTDNTFQDLAGQWFAAYAAWAQAKGIVTGNAFRGDDDAQRQEIALFIYRYAVHVAGMEGHSRQSAQWAQFSDRGDIANWAYDALRWMNYHGIITGRTTTTVAPQGTTTRAEAAMMMMRTMDVMGVGNHVIPPRPAPQPNEELDRLVQRGYGAIYLHRNMGFAHADIVNAIEREAIRLIQNIRREHGLPKFIINSQLNTVARNRAHESLVHASFTHTSESTGLAHTDHARAVGVNVDFAGENLSGNRGTAQGVVSGWMNSPGHRSLILAGHETSNHFISLNNMGFGFAHCENLFFTTTEWSRATLWVARMR